MTEIVAGGQVDHVNVLEADAVLAPHVSQDVLIVGYPFGLITGSPSPVWKRGTLAIDPTYDPHDVPKTYVNATTRPGMSGSVVIARHVVVMADYMKKDGTLAETMLYEELHLVLGLYSGRVDDKLEQAQLGIVWKRNAIEETLAARKVHVPV